MILTPTPGGCKVVHKDTHAQSLQTRILKFTNVVLVQNGDEGLVVCDDLKMRQALEEYTTFPNSLCDTEHFDFDHSVATFGLRKILRSGVNHAL